MYGSDRYTFDYKRNEKVNDAWRKNMNIKRWLDVTVESFCKKKEWKAVSNRRLSPPKHFWGMSRRNARGQVRVWKIAVHECYDRLCGVKS
jgi:hypothetical protein